MTAEIQSDIPSVLSQGPKAMKALVLDAAPFLSHSTPPTSLLSRAERVYTTSSVLAEIRDPQARSRLETQWLPFITTRNPKGESVRAITALAKTTGDSEVLSGTDIGVLALAFEIECELRGGDGWRRKDENLGKKAVVTGGVDQPARNQETEQEARAEHIEQTQDKSAEESRDSGVVLENMKNLDISESVELASENPTQTTEGESDGDDVGESDDDSEGGEWITPSNIDRFRKDTGSLPISEAKTEEQINTACATSDFAMQNILLLLPITVVSPDDPNMRIKSIKTWLLRCHACFFITRVMSYQFCPRCGGPTLLRTSCSTDSATGKTTIYLKKNFQYNTRGNVYSLPKPTGGRANGKEGQGYRHELVLRPDQKEYTRRKEEIERRTRKGDKDLMDGDYLPSILTGERKWGKEKVKVGHGRQNPNATKGSRK